MTPFRKVARDILTELILRAHLREVEEQIQFDRFDEELSGRIDCVKFLLEE
jgi:hypothetical protein